jgi:hypothetical protein
MYNLVVILEMINFVPFDKADTGPVCHQYMSK